MAWSLLIRGFVKVITEAIYTDTEALNKSLQEDSWYFPLCITGWFVIEDFIPAVVQIFLVRSMVQENKEQKFNKEEAMISKVKELVYYMN